MVDNLGEVLLRLDLDGSRYLADITADKPVLLFLFKIFEWGMHGIPWLLCCFMLLLLGNEPIWTQNAANVTIALIIDLIGSGTFKMLVRRARPAYNHDDMIANAPFVDQFSFPSGHTSRTFTLAFILFDCGRIPFILRLSSLIFGVVLGLSRVMLGRHFISDVIGGTFLGFFQAKLVLKIWLTVQMANDLATWMHRMNPLH